VTGDVAGPWEDVAAPGTDPVLLAAVVGRAAADPRGFGRAWTRAQRDGTDASAAVRDLAATPVVTTGPGEQCARAWRARGVRVALAGDPAMPARLGAVEAEPPWLASVGASDHGSAVGQPGQPAVAIVGSRKASAYGRGMAAWLAEAAGDAGCRVVSGGAVGIDAAAHEAALGTAGGTTVVLGCGHDVEYPRPHAASGGLFGRILEERGLVVSESLPSDPPRPWRVRSRNRLVAALADVVVVVEGGARSGALITATWAAEYGIPVLAVPGDARAPGSAAGIRLLRDGAGMCAEPADLLAAIPRSMARALRATGADAPDEPSAPRPGVQGLPNDIATVLVEAWPRPVSLATLTAAVDTPVGAVMAAVTSAQVAGILTRDVDGLRLCRAPAT
jgi:DNA processing protein